MSQATAQELDQRTFNDLRDRIAAYSGIYLDDSRRRSLGSTIQSRLARQGLSTWEDYLGLLDSAAGAQEMVALLEIVVVNETSFFRNPRHFRVLAETVLPELDRSRPTDVPLRLWSAGCSTGQEPYSMAITVAELFGLPPRRPVEILATDISQVALEQARSGLYAPRQLQRMEADYRRLYFRAEGNGYRAIPALREMVRFEPMNLVQEPFPPRFRGVDVVFCRNVTIYFQVETSRRLMANLFRHMNEGASLFIGFSETLWQIFDTFERIQAGGAFYYRKGPASPPRRAAPAPPLRPHSIPGGKSVERPLYLGDPAGVPASAAAEPERRAIPQESAQASYHYGIESLRNGAYDKAAEAFQAALRQEPNLVEAYCGIAQVYANQGQYAEALRACERTLELDDLAEEAYLLRGLVYRQLGQLEQAIADLERATYLNPSSPTAYFHLGNAFLAAQDERRALRAFRRTWRALLGRSDEALVDGVPLHLLRQACTRHIEALTAA